MQDVKKPEPPLGYRWAPKDSRLPSWWLLWTGKDWRSYCEFAGVTMPCFVAEDHRIVLPPDPPAGYRLLVPGEVIPDDGVLYHDQLSLTWEPKASGALPVQLKFDPAATHRPMAVPITEAPILPTAAKPPLLGIRPRWLHEEIRMDNLIRCIARYREEGQPAKSEWYDELEELLGRRTKMDIEVNNA